jgi:hypothetical protein
MEPKQTLKYRTERDPIEEKQVPADALYGVQTTRALENFQISSRRIDRSLIVAFAEIKESAAEALREIGKLDKPVADALRLRRLDVRRGYASPLRLPLTRRLRRWFGLGPRVFGPKVERGAQPQ